MTFRRIPANFMTYNTLVPRCVKDWKDTLFIGFLGSIGKGVFVAARSKVLANTPRNRRSDLCRTRESPVKPPPMRKRTWRPR
ncbi:uncharacterized protein CC84DRAFT_363118 [Paraphaeosphaeria sporulosa]|uniref:Uncharacterized protein n=1 Tax=Paraphaeosphaeria sporulosa TaxID=1460663 RepID=A0A177C0Q0_9PLEO|nr:uncharacterized protein CC84DRAFT_363118 [Paraphaeosphaeria sporulosa]OAG00190.1 hypothetical protein CC84DRAFT_363118 [Paraphaeosphaeria sporulosa]